MLWYGKHGRMVQRINPISLLWTQADRFTPLDYWFYEKSVDTAVKNDQCTRDADIAPNRDMKCPNCDSTQTFKNGHRQDR